MIVMIHTSNFPVNCSAEGRLTVSICVRYHYLWCSALIGQWWAMLGCDWLMRLVPGVSLHPPTTACLPPCYKWGEHSIVRMWELITLITLIQLTSSIRDYEREGGSWCQMSFIQASSTSNNRCKICSHMQIHAFLKTKNYLTLTYPPMMNKKN